MKYMVKVTGERNYTVEFNTENERLNWLNKNAQQFEELDGKWLTNFYNDEVELIETEDRKEKETMTTYNDMYELVLGCYNEVMNDLKETFGQSEPTTPNTSEIIRDYKCEAAEEWEELTLEEVDETFDRIYKAIDEEATLKAQAWA